MFNSSLGNMLFLMSLFNFLWFTETVVPEIYAQVDKDKNPVSKKPGENTGKQLIYRLLHTK